LQQAEEELQEQFIQAVDDEKRKILTFQERIEIQKVIIAEARELVEDYKEMIETCKKNLGIALEGEKIKTGFTSVHYMNTQKVEIGCSIDDIPEEFIKVKTTKSIAKDEIKKLLKAGEEVAGCKLVSNTSVVVK
jgi:hypothetical protein